MDDDEDDEVSISESEAEREIPTKQRKKKKRKSISYIEKYPPEDGAEEIDTDEEDPDVDEISINDDDEFKIKQLVEKDENIMKENLAMSHLQQ